MARLDAAIISTTLCVALVVVLCPVSAETKQHKRGSSPLFPPFLAAANILRRIAMSCAPTKPIDHRPGHRPRSPIVSKKGSQFKTNGQKGIGSGCRLLLRSVLHKHSGGHPVHSPQPKVEPTLDLTHAKPPLTSSPHHKNVDKPTSSVPNRQGQKVTDLPGESSPVPRPALGSRTGGGHQESALSGGPQSDFQDSRPTGLDTSTTGRLFSAITKNSTKARGHYGMRLYHCRREEWRRLSVCYVLSVIVSLLMGLAIALLIFLVASILKHVRHRYTRNNSRKVFFRASEASLSGSSIFQGNRITLLPQPVAADPPAKPTASPKNRLSSVMPFSLGLGTGNCTGGGEELSASKHQLPRQAHTANDGLGAAMAGDVSATALYEASMPLDLSRSKLSFKKDAVESIPICSFGDISKFQDE